MRLEPLKNGHMVVHVNHANILSIQVQWSVDGENWSSPVEFKNHLKHDDPDHISPYGGYNIPPYVLAQNSSPYVDVDVFVDMTRLTRRFVLGKTQPITEDVRPRVLRDIDREIWRKEEESLANRFEFGDGPNVRVLKAQEEVRRLHEQELDRMSPKQRKAQEVKDRRDAKTDENIRKMKEEKAREEAEKK